MTDHIALRDSDAYFVEEIHTSRYTISGQLDDGEWLFFVQAREGVPVYSGPGGFSRLSEALKIVLERERLHPTVERSDHRAYRLMQEAATRGEEREEATE